MKKSLKSVLALLFCVLTVSATMLAALAVDAPTAKVKSVAVNSVTLYWTKVSAATSYQVQYTTDAKTWKTATSGTTKTEHTVTGLTTNKTYGFRVRAVQKKLLKTYYSSWTTMVKAKPIPSQVTGFKVAAVNHSQVKLAWTKLAGVTGYVLYYYNGSAWKAYKTTTANSIIVSNLKLGTNYYFRVRAYKTVSGKAVYGPVSATVKTTPVLAATKDVLLSGVNTSAVRLTWYKVAGAKGYHIYRYDTKKWYDAGSATTYTISGLKPGVKYAFKVRAYSGKVNGTLTAYKYFTTTPATPKNLKINDITESSITFSWDAVSGAAGYQPAYYDYEAKKWTALSLTTSTSCTVSNLEGMTKYAFRVRAYAVNDKIYKISKYATTAWTSYITGKTGLAAPKTITASRNSPTDITVKWSAVKEAAGYMIYRYDVNGKDWKVYDFTTKKWIFESSIIKDHSEVVTKELSFVDAGTTARGEVYRIRAVDSTGAKGAASKSVNGVTNNINLNFTDTNYSLRQKLYFYAIEGATKYVLMAKSPSTSSDILAEYKASEIPTNAKGVCTATFYLAPESIHSVMVIAYKDDNNIAGFPVNWTTFEIGELKIDAKNYYSVNSQLLYLSRAINNTKGYLDTITVENKSEISTVVDYIGLVAKKALFGKDVAIYELASAEKIDEFFAKNFPDEEGMSSATNDSTNEKLTFTGGQSKLENNKTVSLKNYIEPTTNYYKTSILYQSQNPSAWKNGFSKVTTTVNKDGSRTIKLTLKKESGTSVYHDSFMTTFAAADFSGMEGLRCTEASVGESTLTAVIDKDGILRSYVTNSPFHSTFEMSFIADEDTSEGDLEIKKGTELVFRMSLGGSTKFNYKFTH